MSSPEFTSELPNYKSLVDALIALGPLDWKTRHHWREQAVYKNFDSSGFTTDEFKRVIEEDLSFEFDDETNWVAPIHAWRILAAQKKIELIDELILRLIANDKDDDWAHEELPEVLSEFGPQAISHLEKGFDGVLWGQQAFEYAGLSRALKTIAEKHPLEKERVCSFLRKLLSDFELNPPIFNSYLASDLVDLKDERAALIIQDLYSKNFLDKQVMSWEEVYSTFKGVEGISEKVAPIKYNVNDYQYSGDAHFERMLKALGTHYTADEVKCLLLGSILSIEMIQPSAVLDNVMIDMDEKEIDFVCEGQATLFYREFFGLWNELAKYQEIHFQLPLIKDDTSDESRLTSSKVFRRQMQLSSFIEGFTKNQNSSKFMKELWVEDFLEPIEEFLDSSEEYMFLNNEDELKQAVILLEKVESHWNDSYLKFAQSCKAERRNLIERRKFVETHKDVGRNESCPCGSGKKFKKCCLTVGVLH